MVAINIFHEPTFAEKLSNIPSLYQLTALLAAIVGYASRFQAPRDMRADIPPRDNEKPEHFVRRAFQYANKALVECDDEMPPLCVLQALIIATHCQLTRGVRGKAWRSLGLCVRLVYELSLHQLDSEISARPTDTQQWQADEEKRRAFWAVFEMDIFASTIRQTPTAIDWAHMEVLLPVDNANWFQGQPAPSCFMDADKNQCWKALQDSGNQSPKAWFLVINSMMKVAHYISDSQRLSAMGNSGHQQSSQRTTWVEESRQKLEKLGNAVRCFSLALPAHLRYYDQYLSFGAPVQGQLESQRQQHCSLYNIFVMTQLTRLMIHRYDAFRPQSRQSDINAGSRPGDVAGAIPFNPQDTESAAQRQYYEAADGILRIVSQSCEEHIQHINPFLSSTIWLASAVQLVRKHFARAPASRSLIKSRFDVLYLTYRRCVDFWGTQTAMQRNLESLEEQLEARKRTMDARESQSSSDQTSHVGHQKRKRTLPTMPHFTATKKPRHKQPQYIPESPRDYAEASTFVDGGTDVVAQGYARHHPDAVDSMVMLGMMPPSQDRSQTSGQYLMPPSSEFFDPAMGQAQHEQVLDWPTFDFSGGIQDLLAGWTAY
ncbi:uncharacterized protein N7515_003329 [Penicillium bovifimosum]|uniref:Xylanolytic transcriptional activator regulatory domain-containing protein n=1 Tax=Penicillium bovifimosum TaxID=126998 RepID=A0A9W9L5M6_9EURO|nr:uncharacterized protein N7515_003329 [Penicillium bovifimosum]KAJ5138481.1 hypothetical protein N7515_003329 [Penicillium bovifimosum]